MTEAHQQASVIVFLGPSLDRPTAASHLCATYLPPVSQGDIIRLMNEEPPDIIAIVDGLFEAVPAVLHKEILWAMSKGVHVYGASSMGALRAAELERFGMVGVGRIFEDFVSNNLEDDDEVALVHGPKEVGYTPLSVPMVNVRATVAQALKGGIIQEHFAARVTHLAKKQYYADRTYSSLIEIARRNTCNSEELEKLKNWLPTNAVDQKRDDAVELLRYISEQCNEGVHRKTVTYEIEPSEFWVEALREYS